MLYVQENPTNRPNFAINELAGNKLPNLYKLVELFGKNRVSALNLPSSTSKTLIEHRDVVLIGKNRKTYLLSLHKDSAKRSLMITDYRARDGINRTMFFDENIFEDSLKFTKARISTKAQSPSLSEQEQVAFLNELEEPLIDIQSTQRLPIATGRPK